MTTLLHQAGLFSPLHPTTPTPFSPWIGDGGGSGSSILARPLCLSSSQGRRSTEPQAQGSRGFGVSSVPDKKSSSSSNSSPYEDALIASAEAAADDEAIPQVVFDRMIRRIVLSVGVPMASGVGLLYAESFAKKGGLWEVPGWLPLLTILLAFGTSAMGIAYGTLSTSWDPAREGSLLGWEQAQRNWPELWKDDEDDKMKMT